MSCPLTRDLNLSRTTRGYLVGSTALIAIALATQPSAAQRIEIKQVDGKLCARCELSASGKTIPANVVIDLGSRMPLIVHSRTARMMEIDRTTDVSLRFKSVDLTGLKGLPMDVEMLATLTRDHAPELGEIPAVAILGLPAFAPQAVQLEIAKKLLRVLPIADADPLFAKALATKPGADTKSWVVPYREEGFGFWLDGKAPDDYAVRVLLRTLHEDTLIDEVTTDLAGAPGGALDELHVGRLNIARYVALRPSDLSSAPKPRPDVVIGTNLLRHFRMTLDPNGKRVLFEQTLPPEFPQHEREFFVAVADGDADAVEAFLKAHVDSRLAQKASQKLITLRLEDYTPDDAESLQAIERAIAVRARTLPEPRRATKLLELADTLLADTDAPKRAVVGKVLDEALRHAPKALDATASHQIQARLGWLAMQAGDLKQARRHLLSAAFGMPRDPTVNLWMGRLYERMGKLARAWSRYLQAAIDRDAPREAFVGLDRLNRNADFRKPFTMDDAAQLIEGRVAEYHPARTYLEEQASGRSTTGSTSTTPVLLVESFTCLDHAATQASELAFGGLIEYFEGVDVAFVQYHLPTPQLDPLATGIAQARAQHYGLKAPPAIVFNGTKRVAVTGDASAAERVFSACKAAAKEAALDTPGCMLDGEIALDGGTIRGHIKVTRATGDGPKRLHVVLCERRVMVPGANGVVMHRNVARTTLTPLEGYAFDDADARLPIDLALSQLARRIEATLAKMESAGKIRFSTRPTYIDPRAIVVVAWVEQVKTRRVIATRRFDLVGGDTR